MGDGSEFVRVVVEEGVPDAGHGLLYVRCSALCILRL